MSGTSNSLAVREDTALTGALAISADQVQWTSMQEAALNQLGLKNAPNGDRLVFLHVAQRTGLDPFARQIHMIERGGKWSIQTGIDGFRVNRARAEREAGVRGILGQAIYVDAEGGECKRWFKATPPVGCEITYTVRDRDGTETPYTSYLRFTEYAQYFGGKLGPKWSSSPAHMLEKCTEADVYRKAFPQDFSGIALDDAAAGDGSDGPPAVQPQRQRVDAAAARARNPRTVAASVVTPDASPAGEQPPPAAPPAPPSGQPAGEAPVSREQVTALWACLTQDYGFAEAEKDYARGAVRLLASRRPGQPPVTSMNDLTAAEASKVLSLLHEWVEQAKTTGERPRDILAADIASRDDGPREDGESGE
jgi:hypothetical protein